MKNTVYTQSRSTGRLRAAFSVCRHGLLVLSSLAALSAQAGVRPIPNETVIVGGVTSPAALSTPNFSFGAIYSTPLTATTVITGSVSPNVFLDQTSVDQIALVVAEGYQITDASVVVTNYTAPEGTPADGLNVQILQGMEAENESFTSNTSASGSSFESLPSFQTDDFSVHITAPTGLVNEGETTTGSASYVITLTISRTEVPIYKLAGDYIGLVQTTNKLAKSRIAKLVDPDPSESEFKPIPNEALNARLQMTVTDKGRVTGRMTFGPTAVRFTSAFVLNHAREGTTLPKLVIPIRAFNRSLVLNFGTDEENEGYLNGGLVQQGDEEDDQIIGGVRGWKNTWTKVPGIDEAITSYKTFFISNSIRIAVPKDGANNIVISNDSPRGTSFGWVKEGKEQGDYESAGTLADGESFISKGFYGPKGDVLIYQSLYASRGRGSLSGTAQLVQQVSGYTANDIGDPIGDPNETLQGEVMWLKQPSPPVVTSAGGPPKKYSRPTRGRSTTKVDALYPNGFRLEELGLSGSAYRTPAAGEVLQVNGSPVSGLFTGIQTSINFADQAKAGVSFRTNLTVTSQGASSIGSDITAQAGSYPGTFESSYNNLVLSCNTATGRFGGSFQARPPLRTIRFQGIFVYDEMGSSCEGRGFFLGNRFDFNVITPIMTSQRNSGNVTIGLPN